MQIENGNLKTVQSLSLFTAICCILFQMFYTFLPTFKQTLSLECKDLFLEIAIVKFKDSFTWIELFLNTPHTFLMKDKNNYSKFKIKS